MATDDADDGRGQAARPPTKENTGAPEPVKVVDRRWWARDEERAGDDEAWEPSKPNYVEQLEKQLTEKDRLLQASITKYREATEEFEAVRARWRRDIAKDIERGRRTLLVEFLDVIDNLDRAIQSAAPGTSLDVLLTGAGMVRDQFLAKLDGFGVHRIPAVGHPFDPTHHDAIIVVPTSEVTRDGLIVGVVAEGYMIGDDVLRPARVAVARLEPA
jgi:molecular chaperone GrpE